jgi:Rrf2 family protein
MLQLTKKTEYGLIALVHLADRGGELVSVREIGERYPIPKRLLAEVLKDLARAELVQSQRGAAGGYSLARSAEAITLGQIVAALEGRPQLSNCEGSSPARHSECEMQGICRIRAPLHRLREHLVELLERTTLASLQSGQIIEHSLSPRAQAS